MKATRTEIIFWIIVAIIMIPTMMFGFWYHYNTSCMVWEYSQGKDVKISDDVAITSESQIPFTTMDAGVYHISATFEAPPIYMLSIPACESSTSETTVSVDYHNAMVEQNNSKLKVMLASLIVLKSKLEIVNTDLDSVNEELELMIGVVK